MGLFGGDEQDTKSETKPWGPAKQPYKDLIARASGLSQDPYMGDREAAAGPLGDIYMGGAVDAYGNWGPQLQNYYGGMAGLGGTAYQGALTGLSGISQGGAAPTAEQAGWLNNIQGGAAGLQQRSAQAGSMYGQLYGDYGRDPTGMTIGRAGQYADNPYMSGMIDATSRDIKRNLYENELPSLNMQATASGNLNSSRAGAAEAIATRGAADRIGDISSQMRGGAYQSGLGLANSQWGQQLAGRGGAAAGMAGLGQTGYTAGLGGAGLGQDYWQGSLGGQLDANRIYAGMGQTGLNAAGGAYNTGMGTLGAVRDAAGMQQANMQTALNNEYARYQAPWDTLGQYGGIVGLTSPYGTTRGTAPSSGGGALQQGVGLAAGAAALYFSGGNPYAGAAGYAAGTAATS